MVREVHKLPNTQVRRGEKLKWATGPTTGRASRVLDTHKKKVKQVLKSQVEWQLHFLGGERDKLEREKAVANVTLKHLKLKKSKD